VIERRPLWPALPPPVFTRTFSGREIDLVVEHYDLAERELVEMLRRLHRTPDSFMNVSGFKTRTRSPAISPSAASP